MGVARRLLLELPSTLLQQPPAGEGEVGLLCARARQTSRTSAVAIYKVHGSPDDTAFVVGRLGATHSGICGPGPSPHSGGLITWISLDWAEEAEVWSHNALFWQSATCDS